MGPRQIMGEPSSTRKPMDMTFTPQASSGTSFLSALKAGRSPGPSCAGADGSVDVGVEQADRGPGRRGRRRG
jgi:hypothetical protein